MIQRLVCDLVMGRCFQHWPFPLEVERVYQALYRKYRPQTFDDVVGQHSVTETLKAQLSTGRLSHAYLFTGTRGTGKTSCAKILAKAVNCENPHDGNPCNACASCRSIDSGGCMDVLEIDAASNNGVDNVRTLRDDAVYTPSEVQKRVYIIDEVHMLSTAAFNALLKIIEEPPEHLIFILATTELHKVPATILSRCQRFSFRRLLPEDIAARINYVAYEEGISIDPEAAGLLARLADGALRDGLSLLDQCASSTAGTLTAEMVYDCLGLAGERRTAELFAAIADQDASRALELFSGLYAGGKDVAAMLDELCSLSRDLLILRTAPGSGASMLSGVCTEQEVRQLLGRFSAGELLRVTTLLQQTASGFSKSADQRLDAELCLIALCAPELQMDAASLNARLSRLEQAAASGRLAAAVPAAPQEPAEWEEERPPFSEDADMPAVPREPQPEQKPAQEMPVGFWTDLVEGVSGQIPPGNRSLFRQVRPKLQGDELLLAVDSDFVERMIGTAQTLQLVGQKAGELLGRSVRPRVVRQGAAGADGRDRLEELLAFGAQHDDIIEIK